MSELFRTFIVDSYYFLEFTTNFHSRFILILQNSPGFFLADLFSFSERMLQNFCKRVLEIFERGSSRIYLRKFFMIFLKECFMIFVKKNLQDFNVRIILIFCENSSRFFKSIHLPTFFGIIYQHITEKILQKCSERILRDFS